VHGRIEVKNDVFFLYHSFKCLNSYSNILINVVARSTDRLFPKLILHNVQYWCSIYCKSINTVRMSCYVIRFSRVYTAPSVVLSDRRERGTNNNRSQNNNYYNYYNLVASMVRRQIVVEHVIVRCKTKRKKKRRLRQ